MVEKRIVAGKGPEEATKTPFAKAEPLGRAAMGERNWKSPFTKKFWAFHKEKAAELRPKKDYDNLQGEAFEKEVARICVTQIARTVCYAHGFKEVELKAPKEGENSNIIVTVDTFTSGIHDVIVTEEPSVIFSINIPPSGVPGRFLSELKKIAGVFKGYGIPAYFTSVGKDKLNINIVPPPPTSDMALQPDIYAIVPAIGIPPSGTVIAYCETDAGAAMVVSAVSKGEPIGDQFIPTDLKKKTGYYVVTYPNHLPDIWRLHRAEEREHAYGSHYEPAEMHR